jgi:tRNA 2-selenouridine synthase
MILTLNDFLSKRQYLPTADVRSPGEYAYGHIPGTVNIPILNDEERVAVGTDYKIKGKREAISTGFRLVGPRLEQIVAEADYAAKGGELLVHCWRGGMRSSNFCQFIGMAGIKSHQLEGGYKAYRQRAVESFGMPFQFKVIGGRTGSGKSEVLRALRQMGEQVLDLEQMANHKGSAFGGLMMGPQPTTEQFQNILFEEILKLDISKRVWVEDESLGIGHIFLPNTFWNGMRSCPVFAMEVSKEVRIERLVHEYGSADPAEFLAAMEKITKRLGGQHFLAAKESLEQGDMHTTIDILLTYYDKAYSMSWAKRELKVSPGIIWDGKDAASCAADLMMSADNFVVPS